MADIVADAKRARDVIRNLRQLYPLLPIELPQIDINFHVLPKEIPNVQTV